MREKRKILLVEDDDNDRTFFSIAIRAIGTPATLQIVPDGQQAIDYLEGKKIFADRSKYPVPDVIVLDLNLPIVNGFQFLDWHSTSQFSSVPVVVLEGTGRQEDYQKALALGATKIFFKPIQLEKLISIAKEISILDFTQLGAVS